MNAVHLAYGFAETPFLSFTAIIADEVAKAADVRILGIEATGAERLVLRLRGEVSAVQCALDLVGRRARSLGVSAVVRCIARPEHTFDNLISTPNAENPIYGGRDQLLPTDFPEPPTKKMENNIKALGIIETQGLTAILAAGDAMLKAANVTLVGKEKIGAAYVTVIVKGDVAAVKAAVDAGAKAVSGLGKIIAVHVIARPHEDLAALLPK